MGSKGKKRDREANHVDNGEEAPIKRRRQINDEHLKLAKLYEDLAAESDDTRFEAAKQLIIKFSPAAAPNAQAVKSALSRLVKGLCSQRKAARVGFSLTLTELLREIFSTRNNAIEGLDLDAASIISFIEEKTKIEGNVSGRERRDHLIGKLFGFKAVLQSSIILQPELSLECWNKLLDHIFGMARDVPWLREECGMVLVEAIKSLKAKEKYQNCAEEVIARLNSFKLVSTPEGVAVWLTVRTSFELALPEGIWHGKDPLSKKERARLAKVLRENFKDESENGSTEATKTAAASPNPSFAWNLVLTEILRRDTEDKSPQTDKLEFPQFWVDIVDNNLFASSASHERKAWGFKLLSNMISHVPEPAISALFSPNLLRTLINQSKKDDRFLHSAALSALSSIQARVQQQSGAAVPIVVALTGKFGSVEFDRITKTKTLEQLLLSADDESLRRIVRHLNSTILRPESEDQTVADNRRQVVADLLLNTVKNFRRYSDFDDQIIFEKDTWLRKILDCLVEQAYFVPSKSAKTSKVPLPPISDRSRIVFQERLSSCLTKLLDVNAGSRSGFAMMIISMIKTKRSSCNTLDMVFKADESVFETVERALQTLDVISAKGSVGGSESAAEGFILLYSLTLLQVFNGEGDAVMLLDDLDVSRKALSKRKKNNENHAQDPFVEVVLSFMGNQRTLFRRIGEEAFAIFAPNLTTEGLQSLTDILDTEETLEGQKELFNQADEAGEEDTSSDSSGDTEDSDVEMVDEESQDSNDDASDSEPTDEDDADSSEDEESDEDDAELTQFNNLLAMTLQTQKLPMDGGIADDSSEESDMDDDQMMALDPHLSKIFKERSKTTSKKKEREDAKQNMVQFKSRVLDLLTIFLDKQYSNPLTFDIVLPVLRRTRANANRVTAEKAAKMLKNFFDTRSKHKAPLPKPKTSEVLWELLMEIHKEAELGGGAKMHAEACSNASLFAVKVLVSLDKANYSKIVDVYAETQKRWFMDKKSQVQPQLFTQFQNWSLTTRQVK